MAGLVVSDSNFILSIPEATFLAFSAPLIQKSLDQKNNIVFLSTAALMQSRFCTWTAANITDKKFTPEELKLDPIVTSLWNKTKSQLQNLMQDYPEAIKDEKLGLLNAESTEKQLLSQGYEGKAFTLRQACLLMETSKAIIN